MLLDDFDIAVIEFAHSVGIQSERVYNAIDKLDLPYRERCSQAQLLEALESVKPAIKTYASIAMKVRS